MSVRASVRPCVRPSVRAFVTFYKRLHNSFVYEHKFTKPTQTVYVNKGMSLLTFGLILKNKMAARAIFQFFSSFLKTLLLWLFYSHSSQLFRRN